MEHKKRKIVIDILSYVFIAICFLFATVGLVIKLNQGTLYIFNTRTDVVLSDSMSSKNEKYAEFLEGYDNQIQKFDLVVSSKVKSEEDLDVYDIVLFNNPYVGTTVHRIVGKEVFKKDSFTFTLSSVSDYQGEKMILLPEIGSEISSEGNFSFTRVEMVILSKNEYSNGYNFVAQNKEMSLEVSSEKLDTDYYKHTIVATKDSSAPSNLLVVHKSYFDYRDDYIKSISVNSEAGDINISGSDLVESGTSYHYETNLRYLYEIRGDKAPESDGKFELKDIYTKVNTVIPKMGYFVRYITSIWGMIMMIMIGFIIIVTNILIGRTNKKEKANEEE